MSTKRTPSCEDLKSRIVALKWCDTHPNDFLPNSPDDKGALKAMLRSLWQVHKHLEQRAEEQRRLPSAGRFWYKMIVLVSF